MRRPRRTPASPKQHTAVRSYADDAAAFVQVRANPFENPGPTAEGEAGDDADMAASRVLAYQFLH